MKTRVAILGAGHWGPNLLRNFHTHDGSEVGWVIDRDPARLEQVRARYPGVQIGTDAKSAFADPTVEAVVIATPTVTHFKLTREALAHGKHVLVEKPLATDAADAAELCSMADDLQRVLVVGQVFLFNRAVRQVKDYLNQRRFGRVLYLSMIRTNLGPIRQDVNAAWDLAAHDVSIANYWLGGPPVAAVAQGGCWINAGVEDTVFATLWYPDSVIVHLHVSWLSPRKVRDITVVGDHGMLTFDDMNLMEPLRLYDKVVTEARTPGFVDTFASFRTSIREGDIVIPRVGTGEPLMAECDHFLACIRTGERSISDGQSGADAVRALAAMQRSLENSGRREEL